jgi:hypothetical protein
MKGAVRRRAGQYGPPRYGIELTRVRYLFLP